MKEFNQEEAIEAIQKYIDTNCEETETKHKPFYQPMYVIRSKWNPFYWIKGKHKIVWATKPSELFGELNTDDIEITS